LKSKHKRSRAQEEKIAQEMDGRRQPASGALPTAKGDVARTKHGFLVEAKTTSKEGFRITRQLINKVRKEALERGENYLLQLDFEGTSKSARRLAVLDYDVFLMLLEDIDGEDS